MRKRKDGLIINVSSWFGRYANALGGPGYGATKRAVVALTEQLNIEECTNGIRATSVLARRGGDADPREAAGAALARGAREDAAAGRSRPHAHLHRQPAAARLRERDHHQPDLETPNPIKADQRSNDCAFANATPPAAASTRSIPFTARGPKAIQQQRLSADPGQAEEKNVRPR